MTAKWLNPDCTVGKHPACRGDAWNNDDDGPTSCACSCHAPKIVRTAAEIRDAIASIEADPLGSRARAHALRWVLGELA